MIIKLQGMNKDECFLYDTEKVRVTHTRYNAQQINILDWTFELMLVHDKDAEIYDGYLFTLDNDKCLYTELDVWINGEQING